MRSQTRGTQQLSTPHIYYRYTDGQHTITRERARTHAKKETKQKLREKKETDKHNVIADTQQQLSTLTCREATLGHTRIRVCG